ncbi:DUF4862 family protein, partial [Pseudoalteromonas sp.]|uniref:DUF4862 family protein n=1 Tax=Pseudoalteromonas sp. TaxID=53249 RepID=UPI0035657341
IPGTMGELNKDPHFGIASNNEAGRLKAINFYEQANQAIKQLNTHFNKPVVTHIQIHSAPTLTAQVSSSVSALIKSLKELQSWDWHGAKLVLEHCDAQLPNQPSEKGFMRLEDEINALTTANLQATHKLGIAINWGRSAIEARSADGAIQHMELCIKAGLLTGLIFSGASSHSALYGSWKDSHMPPQINNFDQPINKDSALNERQINRCMQLQQLANLDFVGCKISILPQQQSLANRVRYINETVAMISNARLQIVTK